MQALHQADEDAVEWRMAHQELSDCPRQPKH